MEHAAERHTNQRTWAKAQLIDERCEGVSGEAHTCSLKKHTCDELMKRFLHVRWKNFAFKKIAIQWAAANARVKSGEHSLSSQFPASSYRLLNANNYELEKWRKKKRLYIAHESTLCLTLNANWVERSWKIEIHVKQAFCFAVMMVKHDLFHCCIFKFNFSKFIAAGARQKWAQRVKMGLHACITLRFSAKWRHFAVTVMNRHATLHLFW